MKEIEDAREMLKRIRAWCDHTEQALDDGRLYKAFKGFGSIDACAGHGRNRLSLCTLPATRECYDVFGERNKKTGKMEWHAF